MDLCNPAMPLMAHLGKCRKPVSPLMNNNKSTFSLPRRNQSMIFEILFILRPGCYGRVAVSQERFACTIQPFNIPIGQDSPVGAENPARVSPAFMACLSVGTIRNLID